METKKITQEQLNSIRLFEEIKKLVEENFEFKTEREAKKVEEIIKFITKNLNK